MVHFLGVVYRQTPGTLARKADKRESLLVAARAIVAEGGFAAASIAAVAERAGVATGTVYRYFPSKADLFAEVFRRASSREVEVMAEAARGAGSPRDRAVTAIDRWASRAIAGRTLAYALIAEPTMPEVEAERLRFREAYADVLAGLIAEGTRDGSFRVRDVRLAAAAVVGALAEALVGPLAPSDAAVEGRELVAALVEFCLRALGATPEKQHVHA
jgi:AcrR family transcriptional regulator